MNHIYQWRYESKYNIIYRTYRQLKYDYCHKQQQNESNKKYGANRFANAWSQISHDCSNLHIRKTMILRYVILQICKYYINFGPFRSNKIIFTITSWKCMIFTAVVEIAKTNKLQIHLEKNFLLWRNVRHMTFYANSNLWYRYLTKFNFVSGQKKLKMACRASRFLQCLSISHWIYEYICII